MDSKILRLISLLFSTVSFLSLTTIASSSNITAIFGFGDSTTDTGNNNFLLTTSRSNFRPYGQDFPNQEPTGRFSNGELPLDMLASRISLKKLIPPYLNLTLANDQELPTGVCFASAGSGIDPLTAQLAPNALSLHDQIVLFETAILRLKILVGIVKAKVLIENALFIVSSGTNDFTNFYNNISGRSDQFNISGYQDFVLMKLEDAIKKLYILGGRKIVVVGLPPIGCLPVQITLAGHPDNNRTCIQNQNNDSIVYNQKLQTLISRLLVELPNAKILYFDAYNPLLDAINNPAKYGFVVTSKGCCGTGLFEFGPTCREPIATCDDPSKYIFWDAVHPSLAFYSIDSELLFALISSYP